MELFGQAVLEGHPARIILLQQPTKVSVLKASGVPGLTSSNLWKIDQFIKTERQSKEAEVYKFGTGSLSLSLSLSPFLMATFQVNLG